MLFFRAYTLVDITATGVTKLTGDNELERNQQRNWETVLQVLGLRTQPTIIEPPTCIEANDKVVKQYFGELYTGRQKMWQFSFVGEHSGAYSIGQHPVAGLLQDFEQVPVLTGLTETARFLLPIFYPSGAIKNIAIIPLDENKFSP